MTAMESRRRILRRRVDLNLLVAMALIQRATAFVYSSMTKRRSCFALNGAIRERHFSRRGNPFALSVHTLREADLVEAMVGGERYSLVPMPDSMKATTLFVGNICEFVQDNDLSSLFAEASSLLSVPSCVVRKVNTQSMGYGFVSFPSVQEKEAAISRFHNFEWKGKRLKVESIREDDKGVVRIPETMVEYVSGRMKRTRSGENNTLRRISRDDVERLSRGQPSKRKGYGSRNVPHRLNDDEQAEFERAARKGYLSLVGGGNRRTRRGSPLTNIHRQFCDARDRPQILLYKAVGGRAVDEVVIDLSPLRLSGLFDDPVVVEEFMIRWKAEILTEAHKANMELSEGCNDFIEECEVSPIDDNGDEGGNGDFTTTYTVTVDNLNQQAWATDPIWKLPMVSMGIFIGERSNAKTMASCLAKLWDIPETMDKETGHGPKSRKDAGARGGGKTKMKGLTEQRKRGGGHRQAF